MKIFVIALLLTLTSCSTMMKSKTYGAIGGALICATLGAELGEQFSPNEESNGFNRTLGTSIGAISCGFGGYFLGKELYGNDPKNFEEDPIEFEKKPLNPRPVQESLNSNLNNINLSDLAFKEDGVSHLPFVKGLPEQLKRKVKRQKLIKYKVEPQTIKTKDGRILFFSGGEAIEHQYQQPQ